jgi:hypothetical protein
MFGDSFVHSDTILVFIITIYQSSKNMRSYPASNKIIILKTVLKHFRILY